MALVDNLLETYGAPLLEHGFGDSVTLTHGSRTTAAFTALWEDHKYEVVDVEGFSTSMHLRDFSFAVSDAALDSTAFEPRAGDVIAITENGVAKKFEIVPIGNMPAVELESGGYRWKVHTQRVK